MTNLSVNLNKIALLRNTRPIGIPNLVKFAKIALEAGADGITVHPRPDGRHVRAGDVEELALLMQAWPDREFNIEGNPFHNLMEFVRAVRPHQCTLVPDESGQFTSDHGWDLSRDGKSLQPIVDELIVLGVRVSLFMDPQPECMPAAKALGAHRIELYTEPYAKSFGQAENDATLLQYVETAKAALLLGLGINAGHDLNAHNLTRFLTHVPGIMEVSIGQALISDAIEFGLAKTIGNYKKSIADAA